MRFLIEGRYVDLKDLIEREEVDVKEIKVVRLGGTALTTHYMVFIRTQEPLHYHKDHDLTVRLLRGRGEIHLDGRVYRLEEGDTVFIPAGSVHSYRNLSVVSALLATFTPEYDGKDSIKVKGS